MATTTPNYGWTVPTSTDLVKDGATAIETLGDAIDASMNTALGTKKAGMVLLNTTSFSAVTAFSVNDVFSATYNNYMIKFNDCTSSGNTYVTMRMRVAGSDETGANYFSQQTYAGGSSVSGFRSSSATSWIEMVRFDTTFQDIGTINLYNPFTTKVTTVESMSMATANGSGIDIALWGRGLNTTTSYTGFTITSATASTITGSVSVYGFNK